MHLKETKKNEPQVISRRSALLDICRVDGPPRGARRDRSNDPGISIFACRPSLNCSMRASVAEINRDWPRNLRAQMARSTAQNCSVY
jgi:hypothetical protein